MFGCGRSNSGRRRRQLFLVSVVQQAASAERAWIEMTAVAESPHHYSLPAISRDDVMVY
jgi:hypothetical protein